MSKIKRYIASKDSQMLQRTISYIFKGLVWCGMILMWYVVITLIIDTPAEKRMNDKHEDMRAEYGMLLDQYNTVSAVIENVKERDINVFRKLFESNPYDLGANDEQQRYMQQAEYMKMDNDELLNTFSKNIKSAEDKMVKLLDSQYDLLYNITSSTIPHNNIPAIQPVNNRQLTLLAAGKKPLINPFHRAMREHHGVDYLVPEGTAVFATADGIIKSLSEKNSSHGKAITISHGHGYETSYSHLLDIRVKKGDKVKRGDIIALSGNSGLSFAPHLHYEVIFNDMRVDPVHYFFKELTAEEYRRIKNIAVSSMQSFD